MKTIKNYNKPNNFQRHFPPIKANRKPSVKLNLIRPKGNNDHSKDTMMKIIYKIMREK